jgi:pyruvate,water dikinase
MEFVSAQNMRFPAPEEVHGFHIFEKMHAPRPLHPLSSDLVSMKLAIGFTKAQDEYDCPTVATGIMANNYFYLGLNPHRDADVIKDRMTRYMGFLDRIVPLVGQRWVRDWFPMIRQRNEAERDRSYADDSDELVFARYFDMCRWMEEMWYVHGHINFALVPGTALSDFYDEVMSPKDPTESYQILQGYHTRPADAAHELWNLSRLAKANPELRKIFAQTQPRDLKVALEKNAAGKDFLVKLDKYLYDFGWRSDAVFELADATWIENPVIPLGNIARYVEMSDEDDPMARFNEAVKRREDRTAAIRARLASDKEKLAKFERLLGYSKYAYSLTEDHAFYIDQMGIALFRRYLRILGERLAKRSCLAAGDDIFFLYDREVRDAMANDTNFRALVEKRKMHYAECGKVTPVSSLGPLPQPPKPGEFVDPFVDALASRLLGVKPPSEEEQDQNVIDGVAGSPGTYTGSARVVRSLEEAGALQDGEIMVCEMTLPPWVPMFAIAGAVVADVGGTMSHCAIVAREFGVPAVVGSVDGTLRIKTGQTITVNGTNGKVYLDGRAA